MNSNDPKARARSRRGLVSFGAAVLLAMTAATAQVASGMVGTGIDASGNYRQEVQACISGNTQQDQATCLQEARNARAAKERGGLDAYGNHEANALARCEPLSGEDQAACRARVMGYGNTSGSVAGGGILREVETVVLPPGQNSLVIEPKTSEPVVLVPTQPQ